LDRLGMDCIERQNAKEFNAYLEKYQLVGSYLQDLPHPLSIGVKLSPIFIIAC